jgi:predicted hydrolase (HD superfamily)
MINRNEALVLLNKYLKNRDLIRYSLAVEAILKDTANKLHKDEELWSVSGLLHNLDYEYTFHEPEKRGSISSQILDGLLPKDGINAILANNYMHTGYTPTTSLDKAIISASAISDFIFSVVEVTPNKKLFEVDLKLLNSKFNDPHFFNKNVKKKINLCVDFGIDLKSFFIISINSLKKISESLGL